jgi:hypothetical protein
LSPFTEEFQALIKLIAAQPDPRTTILVLDVVAADFLSHTGIEVSRAEAPSPPTCVAVVAAAVFTD